MTKGAILAGKDNLLLAMAEQALSGTTVGEGYIRINNLAIAFGRIPPSSLTHVSIYYGVAFKHSPVVIAAPIKETGMTDPIYAYPDADPDLVSFFVTKSADCAVAWAAIGEFDGVYGA